MAEILDQVYFQRLYLTFKDEIKVRAPSRKQFAAFSLDMAGLDIDRPIYREKTFCDGGLLAWDFAVATACHRGPGQSTVEHAEQRILSHLITNLEHLTYLTTDQVSDHGARRRHHTLHIFTFYSPCSECLVFVEQLVRGLRATIPTMTIVLGYIEMYVEKGDRKPGSEAEESISNIEELYKLEQEFENFRVVEIPNVINQDTFGGKLFVFE